MTKSTAKPDRAFGAARLLGAFVAVVGCQRELPAPSSTTPSINGARRIVALGRLEPAGGVLEIRALPGEVVDRLGTGLRDDASIDATAAAQYGVAEGMKVQSGSVLAWLKSYDLRQTQYDAASTKLDLGRKRRQHEIAVAEAQVEQARVGVVQAQAKLGEVASQQAKVDALGEAAAIAEADVAKLAELRAQDDGLLTEHQLRRQRSKADLAKSEYTAAATTLPHAIKAAQKAVEMAETNVRLAETNLQMAQDVDANVATELELKAAEQAREQSVLRAPQPATGPVDYTVLDVSVEPGEVATQLPAFQIANLAAMACVAEVYEADAKDVRVGQAVKIRSAAFDDPFDAAGRGIAGVVKRIGKLVSSPGLANRNPLAPSDRSVIEVQIEIVDERPGANDQAARLVGMQVTVEFVSAKSAPAPAK